VFRSAERGPRPAVAGPGRALRILLVTLLSLPLVLATGPARAATSASSGPVVLLGISGVRWDDVGDTTPALFSLLSDGSSAALAVRSVGLTACPVDGWLAVTAGRRASDTPTDAAGTCRIPTLPVPTAGGPATVPRWDDYRHQAAADAFDAVPGLLGDTLARAGRTVAAVGPGAAIGAADSSGRVARAWPGIPAGPQGAIAPESDAVALTEQVKAAVASSADVVLVDPGAVRDPAAGTATGASSSDGSTGDGSTGDGSAADASGDRPISHDDQVATLDTRVGLVLAALPDTATVIVASLADSGTTAHLQLVVVRGPDAGGASGAGGAASGSAGGRHFGSGLLRTGSTRQDGLAQSTDLFPTVLAQLGIARPDAAVGSPLRSVAAPDLVDRLQRLTDLDAASRAVDPLIAPFFVVLGLLELGLFTWLVLLVRRSRPGTMLRRRALVTIQGVGVTLGLVPVATFLANLWPWWRFGSPGTMLGLATLTATFPLALVALAGPWRRSLLGACGVAGALIVAVLTADLATGSRLALIALIGGQPLVAGRFYGLSNPTFGVLATGALFAALALADLVRRRGGSPLRAGSAVAGVGLVVTLIDVLPSLGSDFGGPPALVPAFGLLALWVAGVRVTWRRVVGIGVLTLASLVAVSVLDWLRPASDRTHLGRFVQTVLDGGGWSIVARKLQQNLDILTSTPLTLALPLITAVLVIALRRPGRWYLPALELTYRRERLVPLGMGALGILLLLGTVANDSGVSIPPAALAVFAPFLVAITATVVREDDEERAAAAVQTALRPPRPSKPRR
jgi:hypothetical protein